MAIILMKYKPIYKVTIAGEEIGYIKNKQSFEESIKENLLVSENKSVDSIEITINPEYEMKLVNRTKDTNEQEVINKIEENTIKTYKYYEIALSNQKVNEVNTIEEAKQVVDTIKEENSNKELDLSIVEKYTQNEEEVETKEIDIAKNEINEKIVQMNEENKSAQSVDNLGDVNGIKLASKPVSGTITSRYGVSSNIRKSTHTGLDIATAQGTPITAVADGTVIAASYNGSYGNLVKVSHGNNVETWYAHTSKMYVSVGQKVKAGDKIAAVGSTGNSTGPHLHLEIRINGQHVNPQKYIYK